MFCKHAVQEKHIKSNDKNANVKSGKKNDRRKVYFQWMMLKMCSNCMWKMLIYLLYTHLSAHVLRFYNFYYKSVESVLLLK